MGEMLKVGVRNTVGNAAPATSDMSGILSVTASGRYIPYRGINSVSELAARRKFIKSQYVESEAVLLGSGEDMLNGWTYLTSESYGVDLDASVNDGGGYSARIHTSESSSSYTPQRVFSEPQDFSSFDHLHMWVHSDDLSKFNWFSVVFECPDASNRYRIRESASISPIKEMGAIFGDGEVAFQKADFVATGSPDWSRVKRVYFTMRANTAGTEASINIANMRMIKQKPKNAKIIMRMDDGLRSVYDVARPILKEYNIPGTIFINPEWVATDGSHKLHPAYGGTHEAMNLDEIKELHDMGWTVCSHTYNHNLYIDPTVDASENYPRKKYSQAYHDLAATQDWLIKNGFGDGAESHVYGNHYYNAETLKASTDLMIADYSVHPIYSSYSPLPWAESIMHIGAERFVTKEGSAYPVIDTLLERKGLCVPIFHRFDGDNLDGSVSAETLDAVLAYICSKDNLDVITAADLAYATPAALI